MKAKLHISQPGLPPLSPSVQITPLSSAICARAMYHEGQDRERRKAPLCILSMVWRHRRQSAWLKLRLAGCIFALSCETSLRNFSTMVRTTGHWCSEHGTSLLRRKEPYSFEINSDQHILSAHLQNLVKLPKAREESTELALKSAQLSVRSKNVSPSSCLISQRVCLHAADFSRRPC